MYGCKNVLKYRCIVGGGYNILSEKLLIILFESEYNLMVGF